MPTLRIDHTVLDAAKSLARSVFSIVCRRRHGSGSRGVGLARRDGGCRGAGHDESEIRRGGEERRAMGPSPEVPGTRLGGSAHGRPRRRRTSREHGHGAVRRHATGGWAPKASEETVGL